MRILIIDELNLEEIHKAKEYLNKITIKGPIEDIFWYVLPDKILSEKQKELKNKYGPYKISIEIGKSFIKIELLVRAEMIQNIGGGVVTKTQLLHLYELIDLMCKNLDFVTCN
jgi:hypothetical protein